MGAAGTRVSNKQSVGTADIADNAVTTGKLLNGTIIAADLAATSVPISKLSSAYERYSLFTMYSGTLSSTKSQRIMHYFSSPATVIGAWVAHSGLAAGPTAKLTIDVHVVKAIASGAASANSIFRTGGKLTSVSTPLLPGFCKASGVVSGAAGAILWIDVDKHGSAVGTTKKWIGVLLKQRVAN
jgi:hypothetical protein